MKLSNASKRVLITLRDQPHCDLFAHHESVYGWNALEKRGLVRRIPGTDHAELTELGSRVARYLAL